MIMLTGCGNPAEEVLKEIETGDAAKAQQIYEKKVSGDSSAEKMVEDGLAPVLETILEQYNTGDVTKDYVNQQFDIYRSMIGETATFVDAEKCLLELETSKKNFEKGIEFQTAGDTISAYNSFSGVIETDVNYETAKGYMEAIQKQNNEQAQVLMAQAEELFEQQKYQDAFNTAQKAYKLSGDNVKYEDFSRKIIECLATQCEIQNPEAIQTEDMRGRQAWCLRCDGINGVNLNELSDKQIIKTFKEFREIYHRTFDPYGSLSSSFGNTTIGDFYCAGKWYDIHIDDSFGKNDYVEVYSESEQQERVKANVTAAENPVPHSPSGWTTGGPSTKNSDEGSVSDSGSQEYQNALTKGLKYANQLFMSKQAVYDQLTSSYGEGFSEDAAQYAIDHMTDVDWNANALEKAKQYYYKMDMSKKAIYDQLTSSYGEQFTSSQAQYAIDHLE